MSSWSEVQQDSIFAAPENIRSRIRSIDPTCDLFYLAHGHWALMSRPEPWTLKDQGRARRRTGRNLLHRYRGQARPNPVALRCAQLVADGWAVVKQGPILNGEIGMHGWCHWLDEVTHRMHTEDIDTMMDEADKKSDGTAWAEQNAAVWQDWRDSEGASQHAHVFRGRRHFLMTR